MPSFSQSRFPATAALTSDYLTAGCPTSGFSDVGSSAESTGYPEPAQQSEPSNLDSSTSNDITSQDRYSRQILFPGIGPAGQQLLASAHVAIIGVGATGAATASLLARAGVGALTLIDRDFVEPSNLQRQILFDEADARESLPKAEAARRKIALFNSTIKVHSRIADLTPANIHELLSPAGLTPIDLILDATDNFETRYLINDYAVQQSKPWIYAAAIGAYAATMNILPHGSKQIGSKQIDSEQIGAEKIEFGAEQIGSEQMCHPEGSAAKSKDLHFALTEAAKPPSTPYSLLPTPCLSCIFPKPPTGPIETCDTAGILATAVNLAASIQTTEALKFLTNQPHLMRRTLLSFDLWTNERSEINTSTPNPNCPVCAHRIFSHLAGEGRPHITLCGRNSVQIHEHHRPVDFAAMRTRLAPHGEVRFNNLLLRFTRPPHTFTLFPDGRCLIQGTTDITLARSLYARFIGS